MSRTPRSRDPAGLCAELAGDGLRVDRTHQRELAEYLNGVTVSERVTNVGKTGWHEIDGNHAFVLPAETISADMSERVMLDTRRMAHTRRAAP
jgi:hypothetical protein